MTEVIIGSTEWYADLAQFSDAINTVTLSQSVIQLVFAECQETLNTLEGTWQSPAGSSYAAAQQTITSVAGQLVAALGQILTAMNTTMANYQQSDQTNSSNLS
jgi:uncharacterized protein YukE